MRREKKQEGAEGEDEAQNKPEKASINLGVQGRGVDSLPSELPECTGTAGLMITHSPSHPPGIVSGMTWKRHDFPAGVSLQLRLTSKMLLTTLPEAGQQILPKGNKVVHFQVYHQVRPHSAQRHAAVHVQ